MAKIELDRHLREDLARRLVRHLKDEFDIELAPFDSVSLIDHLAETLGPHFYNQALEDAQAIVRDRAEATADAISAIEKPLPR